MSEKTNERARAHTPGPWRVERSDFSDAVLHKIVSDAAPWRVASIETATGGGCGPDVDRAEANAALIAAAPDLLAVLRAVEWGSLEDDPEGGYYRACPSCGGGDPKDGRTPEDYSGHEPDCSLVAAIAKAEGRMSCS